MTVELTKLSGTGNTFLFFDGRDERNVEELYAYFDSNNRSRIARLICDPYQSVGADGLVFVENSVDKGDIPFRWDFYNADGSSAEMCGNASRCMALYIQSLGFKERLVRFESGAGIIEVSQLENGDFDVQMPQITALYHDQTLKLKKKNYTFTTLNSGVPHVVLERTSGPLMKGMDEKTYQELAEIDQFFKGHVRFRPKSTNVTFYKILKPGSLESLTFERGVKGYTQACGTGAVAAAVAYRNTKKYKGDKVHLTLPGGRVIVDLSQERPHLIGPAKVIAKITLGR